MVAGDQIRRKFSHQGHLIIFSKDPTATHKQFSFLCDTADVHWCELVHTLILLSFIWIFLETTLAQYFSPRKSQNILPKKAFTQASGSTVSPELRRI